MAAEHSPAAATTELADLSACPFCGSDSVDMHPNDIALGGAAMATSGCVRYAHCNGCGAEGPQSLDSGQEAVAAWNARTGHLVHRSEVERLEAERDGIEQQRDEFERQAEALEEKLKSLAPHGSCACSYDRPGDVCSHHSPALAAAEAQLAQRTRELEEARDSAHYANGVADLAMKHRDESEAKCATYEAERDGMRAAHGIYIASKTAHAPRWRDLRAAGVPIISTWIDEAGVGETACFADLWRRCVAEAASAEFVLVYREPGEVLKGAFVEVGAALASGKPVRAVGCDEFSFVNHALVASYPTLDAALAASPALSSPVCAPVAGDAAGGGSEALREDVYADCLRVVCHHLDLPHSESGPCDDSSRYDRALSSLQELYEQAEAERVEHRAARYAAEAEVARLKALATPSAQVPRGDAAVREALAPVVEAWLGPSHAKSFRDGLVNTLCVAFAALTPTQGEVPAGTDWRDIAGAPKNGTRILATDETAPDRVFIVRWEYGEWRDGGRLVLHLTHWQPLSAPPTLTTEPGR